MAKKGERPTWIDTFTGDVDLEDYKERIVVRGTDYTHCALPGAAGATGILGIIWGKPQSGTEKTISVVRQGLGKVKLAGTVAAGDYLEVADALGRARIYTATSGNGLLGEAEEPGVTGDVITVNVFERKDPGNE